MCDTINFWFALETAEFTVTKEVTMADLDADLALAIQLQEEEEENARKAASANASSNAPAVSTSSNSNRDGIEVIDLEQEGSSTPDSLDADAQLARQLQREEGTAYDDIALT